MPPIRSQSNKPVIAHSGFMHRFDKNSSDGAKLWRCLKDHCLGRTKTDFNDIFIEFRNRNHSHPASEAIVVKTVITVITSMKARAETESSSRVELYRSENVQLATHPAASASLPTYAEMS